MTTSDSEGARSQFLDDAILESGSARSSRGRGRSRASVWALHSVLGSATRIGDGSLVEDSVPLAGASIGLDCRLRKAVVAEGCQLPAGTVIGESLVADRPRFEVSAGGVVLITPEMLRQPALAA